MLQQAGVHPAGAQELGQALGQDAGNGTGGTGTGGGGGT